MLSNKKIVLQTICYADIFDYPLTFNQLHEFAIGAYPVSQTALGQTVSKLKKEISVDNELISLKGREELFVLRNIRQVECQKKMKTAKKVGRLLSYIPTIKLIGISGGLSINNADKQDDIDLFLIVAKNTIWISRFLTLFVFQLLGRRRRRNDHRSEDKLCLNMLLDESALSFSQEKQNLYVAHEIIQLNVLYAQKGVYGQFLQENDWVKKYLYNGYITCFNNLVQKSSRRTVFLPVFLFQWINSFAKVLQLWYMKDRISNETITDTVLAFHPNDYTTSILQSYNQKIKKYEKI